MPGAHAILSASGAHRWMACPPSARLEEKLKDRIGEGSSPFAEEGTKAHALAELKLLHEKHKLGDKEGMLSLELDESAVKKFTGAREAGIAADTYVSILEDTAQEKMPADKKPDGKTINGSRKEKVVAYLNDQVQKGYITEEQKSFFIHDVYGWK